MMSEKRFVTFAEFEASAKRTMLTDAQQTTADQVRKQAIESAGRTIAEMVEAMKNHRPMSRMYIGDTCVRYEVKERK